MNNSISTISCPQLTDTKTSSMMSWCHQTLFPQASKEETIPDQSNSWKSPALPYLHKLEFIPDSNGYHTLFIHPKAMTWPTHHRTCGFLLQCHKLYTVPATLNTQGTIMDDDAPPHSHLEETLQLVSHTTRHKQAMSPSLLPHCSWGSGHTVVAAIAAAHTIHSGHGGAGEARGAHLGQHTVQPLKWSIEVQLYPARSGGDRLPSVWRTRCYMPVSSKRKTLASSILPQKLIIYRQVDI